MITPVCFRRPDLDGGQLAGQHERPTLRTEPAELGGREREVDRSGTGLKVGDDGRIKTAAEGHGAKHFEGGGRCQSNRFKPRLRCRPWEQVLLLESECRLVVPFVRAKRVAEAWTGSERAEGRIFLPAVFADILALLGALVERMSPAVGAVGVSEAGTRGEYGD